MRIGARVVTAGMLGLLPATSGLFTGSLAAEVTGPVQLVGGCWTYLPSETGVDADGLLSPPATDVSEELLPWTVGEAVAEATLAGAGSRVAAEHAFTVSLPHGPVLSDDAVTGTAYFLLSVSIDGDQQPDPIILSQEFELEAGAAVEDLEVSGELPIRVAGAHVLRLESVYFDLPGAAEADVVRTACNAQAEGEEGGPNPATDPLPLADAEGAFVESAFLATVLPRIDQVRVSGQVPVTDPQVAWWAARPGDTVRLSVAGFTPETTVAASLCAGAVCPEVPTGEFPVTEEGAVEIEFVVPDAADRGFGYLRLDGSAGGTQVVPLRILADPQVTVTERPTADGEVEVIVAGGAWDPRATVVLAAQTASGASADPAVNIEVDPDGSFSTTLTLADVASERLLLTQARRDGAESLRVEHVLEHVPTGVKDPSDPGGEDPGDDPGTDGDTGADSDSGSTTTGSATTPPAAAAPPAAAPPAAIPLPGELDVTTVPAPVGDQPPLELTVSSARLSGSRSFGELFGGAPSREVVFMVENTSAETVTNPVVRLGLGRTGDAEPLPVAVQVGELAPGDQVVLEVPVELPLAAIGTYQVVGQVGETSAGAFTIEWKTYPWGLFALNGLAVALLAWGVQRKYLAPQRPPAQPLLAAGAAGAGAADAVVDLKALDRWLRPPGAPAAAEHDSIVDLDAAEAWWARAARRAS